MKIKLFIFSLSLLAASTNAQDRFTLIDQTNTARLLQIRPTINLGILPDYIGDLMVQTNLDVQYWQGNSMDYRASILTGSFTGIQLGGTLHTHDELVKKSTKFIIKETESSRTFYKMLAPTRKIFGFTGDVKLAFTNVGKQDAVHGLFTQIRGGIDMQMFTRVYLEEGDETYRSNRNGWFSIKVLGLIQYYSEPNNAINIDSDRISFLEFGALGSMSAVKSPWKGFTMALNLDLGLTVGSQGITPIITPGFGVSINLIKPKETDVTN